ncbi:MAG: Cof-type HAD-IIB family hydrolase [Oscillospiraceae bacterium]|jgi:Cof subfamily protein (haloacid dehalogenase superfamily)|nr:Cof-type HAD-IIB family hydrolase [Oscillospiraceae bacterium]
MKYRLIASDMDGTLLNNNHELTDRTRRAIIKTVEAGVMFVVATGRPFSNVGIIREIFDTVNNGAGIDMPFIVYNGAAAFMGKSEKQLFEEYLDFDLACEAFSIGQKLDIPQIVWTGPQLWANRISEETNNYHCFCKGLDMKIISDLAEIKDEVSGVSKVLWISEPNRIKKLGYEMSDHFGYKLNCFSSMPIFLEFVSANAGKGIALAEICKLYDISSSEVIAVGDAYNDVSMMDFAGFSVAVENAPEDIKEICDYITLSNENDGVADLIEKFILI